MKENSQMRKSFKKLQVQTRDENYFSWRKSSSASAEEFCFIQYDEGLELTKKSSAFRFS